MPISDAEREELADLESKLAARTQSGKPIPGYKGNVAALNRRIAELRKRDGQSFTVMTL